MLSYQTAYLKTHYTTEFFTALLTVFGDDKEKVAGFIQDARQYGIQVLLPDVNESNEDFKIVDDYTIRYGLNGIKGLPDKAIASIMAKRPFQTVQSIVLDNEKSEINKKAVDTLTWSGALDNLSGDLTRLDTLKQLYYLRGDGAKVEEMPDTMTSRALLEEEKACLGVYLSGHPLDELAKPIDWESADDGRTIEGLAMVNTYRKITTKKGDPMSFIELEFVERTVEGVIFPNVFEKEKTFRSGDPLIHIGELIEVGMVAKVKGSYQENHRGDLSFVVYDLNIPVKANKDFHESIQTTLDEKGFEPAPPPQAPHFSIDNLYA